MQTLKLLAIPSSALKIMVHKPSDAAKMLGVSTNTIRNWCDTFSAHLSEEATPPPGAMRRLTERDIEVLRAIAAMREESLQLDEINERLFGMAFPEISPENAEPSALVPSEPSYSAIQSTNLAAFTEALQNVSNQQQRIDELDRRLRIIERWRYLWQAVAFVLAMALIVALVLLSVAYMG